MRFKICYSDAAIADLRGIYAYITKKLLRPDAATIQYYRISEAIKKLAEMPMRYPLYNQEPWHSQGMRWFPVDNYLVFYYVDKRSNTVNISRIIYKGRDIGKQPLQ